MLAPPRPAALPLARSRSALQAWAYAAICSVWLHRGGMSASRHLHLGGGVSVAASRRRVSAHPFAEGGRWAFAERVEVVQVRVMASGVNPVDAYIRSGNYSRLPPLPYTPGAWSEQR